MRHTLRPALAMASLISAVVSDAAAQYETPPPVVAIGGGSIAAWPPPHELEEDPRILDTLTKEIFIQEGSEFGVAGPGNQPLMPVPTNDWWTNLIMDGDNGQLWQYPLTVRAVAAGIEIRSIGAPSASTTWATSTTLATLRIGGVEPVASTGQDITVADFEGGDTFPGGWQTSGNAFHIATHPSFPGTKPSNFQGTRFASSKPVGAENTATGELTSPPIAAVRDHLHFRMGGGNNPNLRAELLVNGSVAATTQRNGGSGANLAWQKFDISSHAGQDLRLRFVDAETGGWGYLTVDEIVLSDNPVDPQTRDAAVFDADKARASSWSDWMFTFRKTAKSDPAKTMDVTLVRCSPMVWIKATGIDPAITFDTGTTPVFRDEAGAGLTGQALGTRDTLAIEVEGCHYGIHVAAGTEFEYNSAARRLVARLPRNERHLVVSALPGLEHLATFASHAYAKPVATRVDYDYRPEGPDGGRVRTTWTFQLEALRPGATRVLQGWLAPHYRGNEHNLSFVPGLDYATPRGRLRCASADAATGFTIDYRFNGVMSHLAAPRATGQPGEFDRDYLIDLLDRYDASGAGIANDTYFGAKNLVLHARAMLMARELGRTSTYQNLKNEIKASLGDWFTYQDGETNHYFARNDRWGSMIGFNFVWDFNLGRFTDIHFHYGYYVLAYAYVAMDDPGFRDQYKEIAIELAKAYAEWDRQSSRYPWMRTFEPMVGHSYAGGSSSGGGNNQESSSESIQSWAGLFLLGEALRGNDPRADEILAAGAFGYAIETRAVLEYYQDYHGSPCSTWRLDHDNQPAAGNARHPVWPDEYRFNQPVPGYPGKAAWRFTNGIMNDSGNTFVTYFGTNPEFIYGIQWLPNAPHMMFLAHDKGFTSGQFDAMMSFRDEHLARGWLGSVANAPATLRNQWHMAPTATLADPRLHAIDNPWSGADMTGLVRNLHNLNPAFVKDISNEGHPTLDNPLYDHLTQTWLVTFPADNPRQVEFPAAVWTPDNLAANHAHLVPPADPADLPAYSLQVWSTQAFLGEGRPGVDWTLLASRHGWSRNDYPDTPAGRAASITQLTDALEDIGGSWPLIALAFQGFSDPDFALEVVAESRRRGNRFATHTESGMFNYYYFHSIRGLGRLMSDQHLAIPTSQVYLDDATGARTYMVHNKSADFELVPVYQNGAVIGSVLAKPSSVTVQQGLYATAEGFAAIGCAPAAGSTGVPVATDELLVVFSEPVNAASAAAGISLSGPGAPTLTPQPSSSPRLAVFKVNGIWQFGAGYTIHVDGGVENAAGTATLGAGCSFPFTMQGATGLVLTATKPAAGASNVDPSLGRTELAFNHPLRPDSVGGVALSGPGDPVLTHDSAASSGATAVFTISRSLKPGGTYTLTIPAAVTDVYGQTLGAPATVGFTTRQAASVLDSWDTSLNVTALEQASVTPGRTVRGLDGGTLHEFQSAGEHVSFTLRADNAGIYSLAAQGKHYNPRGDIRLLVNGSPVDGIWDQSVAPFGIRPFDFGNVALVKGANTFRFEVAGVNGTQAPWFHLLSLAFSPVEVHPPPGPAYEAWRIAQFGPGSTPDSGPGDDFDRDGLLNLLEHAFGTNPRSGTHPRYPAITRDAAADTVTVAYPKAASGLIYQMFSSPDLVTWNPVSMAGETCNPVTSQHEVVIPLDASADERIFIRMVVSESVQP